MGLLGEVFDPVTSYVRLDISLKFQHTNSHRYILNRPYCVEYKRIIMLENEAPHSQALQRAGLFCLQSLR